MFLLQLCLQQKYGIKATTYETIFLKEIVYIQCQFALQIFFFLSKILIFIQAHIGHIYGHLNYKSIYTKNFLCKSWKKIIYIYTN